MPNFPNILDGGNTYLSRFLDTNGDGTGAKNANGDFSGAAQNFFIQPAAGQTFNISRLVITIRDAGSLDAGNYGNNITLTNGIEVKCVNDVGILIDLTNGVKIFTNTDWARYGYDITISSFGAGNNYLNIRWSFLETLSVLMLSGVNNERLQVTLNDNFTGLVQHFFMAQGFIT